MNNYILIFVLFFSFNLFCQNTSNLNIPHETTIYSSEDTIIGLPFITNHDFNFLINNSFSEFSDFNNGVLTFDFTDYVKKINLYHLIFTLKIIYYTLGSQK